MQHLGTTAMNWPAARVRVASSLALLLAAVWVADFWHSRSFGLHEDDFTFIPRAITMDLPDLMGFVFDYIANLYGHGRPLSDSIISLFSFLGWRLAGLSGIYWIGFAIVAINAGLFYALLKRLGGQRFALPGGLAFALFPADTTQPFLTHSLGLQPSLTFLLLAYHAYLSGRCVLSYAVILGSLFCYETAFPLFLGAPLLTGDLNRRKVRELTGHAIVMGVLIGAAVLLRLSVGEDRVPGLEFPEVVLTPLRHMVVGPLVTLGAFWLRPVQAILAVDAEVLVFTTTFFAIFWWVLSRSKGGPAFTTLPADLRQGLHQLRANRFTLGRTWNSTPPEVQAWLRQVLAGLALLVLAYPLTFDIRSFSISGRDTRVHLTAVVGASILFGCSAVRLACSTDSSSGSGPAGWPIHYSASGWLSWSVSGWWCSAIT